MSDKPEEKTDTSTEESSQESSTEGFKRKGGLMGRRRKDKKEDGEKSGGY